MSMVLNQTLVANTTRIDRWTDLILLTSCSSELVHVSTPQGLLKTLWHVGISHYKAELTSNEVLVTWRSRLGYCQVGKNKTVFNKTYLS